MATTTPNFGWSVPTSTDLVKDGATAIETLGDSIDASLVDLKGGTTGQVLAKNSGTDMDFTWIAAEQSGPAFRAFRNTSNQSLNQSTLTKVQLNGESYDTDSCFDSTTNYRFTANKAGYYQINAGILINNSTDELIIGKLYKNGSNLTTLFYTRNTQDDEGFSGSDLVYLNGTTDYIELYARADGGGTREVGYGSSDTFMSGVWIRS
jgi:hypothetical protein